jgi:hypothetical protein
VGISHGNLDMGTEQKAYANLVGDGGGVPADGVACGSLGAKGLLRVDPGNPNQSLLYNKVATNDGDGGSTTLPDGGEAVFCGNPMPLHEAAIPSAEVQAIQDWIAQGGHP